MKRLVQQTFRYKNVATSNQQQQQLFVPLFAATSKAIVFQQQMRPYSKHGQGGTTFMDLLKNTVKQELSSNQDLQQKVKELQETGTVQTAKKVAEGTKTMKDTTATVISPVTSAVSNTLEKGSEVLSDSTEKVLNSAPVKAVTENVKYVAEKVAEQPVVKMVVDELTEEQRENLKEHYFFRSTFGRKDDEKAGIYYNPYTGKMEKLSEQTVNTEATGISVELRKNLRPKTAFDKIRDSFAAASSNLEGSNNPLVNISKNLISGVGNAVGAIGNSVFKPNEQSEALTAIKTVDSSFVLERFMKQVENVVIPKFLHAYFTDDIPAVKRLASERCWRGHFYPLMEARKSQGHKFDTKILDIREVELVASRFIGDNPVLVVQTQVQYIFCVKDKKGEIVEGHKNDIRLEGQLWVFQIDTSGETKDWEIAEVSFGGAVKIV